MGVDVVVRHAVRVQVVLNEALRSDLSMSLFKLSMCPVVRAASLLRSSLSSYLEHKTKPLN